MAARMYPGTPVPNAQTGEVPPGEEIVFYTLRARLPEDWIVMHSVRDDAGKINYEADFVILVPHRGILVLEIKSHYQFDVENDQWFTGKHREPLKISPKEQAFFASKDFVERRTEDETLVGWSTKAHKHYRYRYAHAAILPCAKEVTKNGKPYHFTPEEGYICGKDALDKLNLEETFISFFGTMEKNGCDVPWYSPAFEGTIMENLREKAKPSSSFVMDPVLYRACIRKAAERASVLMEATAASSADVTVRGCAGSGKTVMLRREAIRLCNEAKCASRSLNILILCFNAELAKDIKAHFGSVANKEQKVRVSTFHNFLGEEMERVQHGYNLIKKVDKTAKNQKNAVYDVAVNALLDYLCEQGAPLHYDHIFVDEAQDFQEGWFDCLQFYRNANAAKGQIRGRLYYFCDSNQTLYARSNCIPPTPMQMQLKYNLRNSRQIALFNSRSLASKVESSQLPIPLESVYGKEVFIEEEFDLEPRKERLKELVSQLVNEEGVNKQDIVVLSPYAAGNATQNSFGNIASSVRKACTIRKFKGLEADHIILTDIALVDNDEELNVQSFHEFYVAATRAKYALYILPAPGGRTQLEKWMQEATNLEKIADS